MTRRRATRIQIAFNSGARRGAALLMALTAGVFAPPAHADDTVMRAVYMKLIRLYSANLEIAEACQQRSLSITQTQVDALQRLSNQAADKLRAVDANATQDSNAAVSDGLAYRRAMIDQMASWSALYLADYCKAEGAMMPKDN